MTATVDCDRSAVPALGRTRVGLGAAALYTCTAFVGAGLLFLVQPIVAKLLLPLFGGSPSVWNTSNLFFQVNLLAGYIVTHLSVRRFGVRRQSTLQVGLVLLPLLALPIGLPLSADTPAGIPTVLWLLVLLAVSVGAPFLVLSTTGPLLQRWFGATGHPRAQDPYFLFAAGNTGSLLALVSYPTLVEPWLAIGDQLRAWSLGYAVFVVLIIACAIVLRSAAAPDRNDVASHVPVDVVSRQRRLRWVALAALPSSLMLGATTHLSTDLAPIPLLWVVPLSLYLVTFIIAFALSRASAQKVARGVGRTLPWLVVPVVLAATGLVLPFAALLISHLVFFAAVALVAHAKLAADRPGVANLTGFYLVLAVGGALGGAVNALIAPVIFDRVYEYPLGIALAILLVPALGTRKTWFERRYGVLGTILVVAAGVAALPILTLLGGTSVLRSAWSLALVAVLLTAVVGAVGVRNPRAFTIGLALVLVAPLLISPSLTTRRTFFGVQQVTAEGGVHELRHGTTVHGLQDMRGGRRHHPRGYYHRAGPVGQIFAAEEQRLADAQWAVVGLGTGAMAAYGQPGQTLTFFEIDAATVDIARDPRLFRYLHDSQAEIDVVLGDGRLSLVHEPAGRFDLLVIDAFSSDAIPAHLVTQEAVDLYASRLAEDGLLVFHISNRYVDLAPVLADIASDAALAGVLQRDGGTDLASGKLGSSWVVLSRDADALSTLQADPRWQDLAASRSPGSRTWTDDFSNVLGALS